MPNPLRRFLLPTAIALLAAPALAAPKAEAPPQQETTYICPNATGGAVDCFLHAVEHLYTMCRQVKSIEIIEFGYEKSTEGTNGAKSEYCVDKQRLNITRPYQLALREATGSRAAVDELRALYEMWQKALATLNWVPGERDDDYKARVAKPYEAFTERASLVRAALTSPAPAAAHAKSGPAAATPVPVKGKP